LKTSSRFFLTPHPPSNLFAEKERKRKKKKEKERKRKQDLLQNVDAREKIEQGEDEDQRQARRRR